MKTDNWDKAKEIFGEALKLSSAERPRFLDQVCANDEETRREVESLLASLDTAESFLETPVVDEIVKIVKTEPKSLENGTRFGHYEIIKMLGVGGMGEVYLAQDKKLDRQVAIKILNEKFAKQESNLRRFKQEAKAASALNHPNILVIHEIGVADESNYIVSEFIEGKTLRDSFKESPMGFAKVFDISIQIANALNVAHTAHIIHRDIKPENIMIRPDGYLKVLDFGLAKLVEQKANGFKEAGFIQNETAKGVIMGTVNYMSPEQANGERIDKRTDIFSLGAVIYEMIAGRTPFQGKTFAETFANLINTEPQPLSLYASNVPNELQRIVSKMLKKITDERYQKMEDLLVELKLLQKRLEFETLKSDFSTNEIEEKSKTDKNNPIITDENINLTFDSASTQTQTTPPNNLSIQYTKLIGREKEIAEIKSLLLQEDVRLLTMTGVGGTGKTTLALAVARDILTNFADGVFLVELAAITNPELVASTIAQPLGVKEAGEKLILEVLKDYLREKQLLLIIDNFEQVVDIAPQISELLINANNLKVLITSRVLLHLTMEREFVVPPLSLPSEVSQVSLAEISEYEAIKLFVERAQNVKSSFKLTEENSKSVVEICRRLDGLPLAIELAAARIKILSSEAILTKLANRLNLLTGGARDLPSRQQTMRGAVEWSYELLSEDEKRLFRWLAVFTGGFTFETVETVCANFESEKEQMEVLNLITSLVNKSLLVAKEKTDGETRFRMLEVVREYALESLERSEEAEVLRRKHATYFLTLAEEAEPHLQTTQAVEWLNRLEDDHDNLRAALHWSLDHDIETAARLATAIRFFWSTHSHITEGRKWLQTVLDRSSEFPDATLFKLLNWVGMLSMFQGDHEMARKMYEKGLAAGNSSGDKQQVAWANTGLGVVAYKKNDYQTAQKFIKKALTICREIDSKYGTAISLNVLGDIARTEGKMAIARPLIEEALAILRQISNRQAETPNLLSLGAIAYAEGDYEAADSYFAKVLAMAQELGQKTHIAFCLDGFAALAVKGRESKYAACLSGAAERLCESIGYEAQPAERRFREDYLAELHDSIDEVVFSSAYEQGRKMKLNEVITLVIERNNSKVRTVRLSASTNNIETHMNTTLITDEQTF